MGKLEQGYLLDSTEEEKEAYEKHEEIELKEAEKSSKKLMGDMYDVYSKAVGVHSNVSSMTEDYVLTRYNIDIYNQKFPKFVREQRKILRIIKSFLVIPLSTLKERYNNPEKAEKVYASLLREYLLIEDLLLGELDECVIMARTPEGDVIKAFLKHGLNPMNREDYDLEIDRPNAQEKLKERERQ